MRGEAVMEAARARAGDGEAELERQLAALVQSQRERALRLAWRLVGGDDAAAEDVTQEAFVRAWRGLPRFRGEARLSTWLYRIVVRQAANHRRWRAVTAAALAGAVRPAGDVPRAEPSAEDRADRVAWEQDVIFADALEDPFLGEDEDLLPPDYLALAGALDF